MINVRREYIIPFLAQLIEEGKVKEIYNTSRLMDDRSFQVAVAFPKVSIWGVTMAEQDDTWGKLKVVKGRIDHQCQGCRQWTRKGNLYLSRSHHIVSGEGWVHEKYEFCINCGLLHLQEYICNWAY